MHIGARSVRALTVRVHVRPSQTRAAVMIPNVVIVPQASLGRLRVPRLDIFDFKLALPCCNVVVTMSCFFFSFLFCLAPFVYLPVTVFTSH